MNIEKIIEGNKMVLCITGRADTVSAPMLANEIEVLPQNVTDLVLDFDHVDYISSACLRVLLSTQKKMNGQGTMQIINANRTIQDVFEMTGFSTFVNIKYKR